MSPMVRQVLQSFGSCSPVAPESAAAVYSFLEEQGELRDGGSPKVIRTLFVATLQGKTKGTGSPIPC